ncbi:solute carrier family 22 member 2-like isoform X1 [Rhincodon typus]|uniref:solute carrier family 22 member 2-like isoform X1 n=1 Tax=Rhincodon typus TaxID=259920 RepID=UPI0009A42CDB|nr:solute carrier family 22 member 2-like isoform X1 [Rhincodon typus]
MLTFDDVLEEVGGFGLYQKITFFFVCLPSAVFSYLYVGFVFLAVTPDHWCRSPGVTELRDKCNWSLEQEKNYTLPVGQSGSSSYSQCEKYDIDWNSSSGSCENPLLFIRNGSQDLPLITCQDGWIFKNDSISSIVTEFELVCADSWKLDLSQACLNLGFTLGTVIMGYAADRFGRKLSFLFATFVTSVLGLVVPFLPNYSWFLTFRTLQGLFSKGSWVCAYVFITELVGLQYRRTVGVLYQVCYSSGMMLLSAVAYFIPDWRNLQLATTIPNFFFLTYYWLIPESPRWMLSQKKNTEALNVIQQMAKRNGKSFSNKIEIVEECSEDLDRPSFVELVRTPQMRKHTFILMFNWFAITLVYQGLIMRLGTLGGNIYLDFFISGAVEIPAAILILLTIERIGRRLPFAAGGLLSGGTCLIAAFIPENISWLATAIAFVGKLGITMCIEMVIFVNTELYPTFIRNLGVSVCSSLCDIGGIAAPFIVYRLSGIWKGLPLLVLGMIGLIVGGLVLLLPETKGLTLPDTIEDVENLKRPKKKILKRHHQQSVLYSTDVKDPASVKMVVEG